MASSIARNVLLSAGLAKRSLHPAYLGSRSLSSWARITPTKGASPLAVGISKRFESAQAGAVKSDGAQDTRKPDRLHGSQHWTYERILSFSLLPTVAFAFIYGPQPINDFLLGFQIPLHNYIGLQAAIVDYLPERRTKVGFHVATWSNRVLAVLLLGALWMVNTKDRGVTQVVADMWHARRGLKDQEGEKEK